MCGGEKVYWLISSRSYFTVNLELLLKKFVTHLIGNTYYMPNSYHPYLQMKKPGSRIHHPLNQYATHYLNSILFKLIRYGKPTSNLKTKGSFLQVEAQCRIDLRKDIAQDHTANSCHHGLS